MTELYKINYIIGRGTNIKSWKDRLRNEKWRCYYVRFSNTWCSEKQYDTWTN